MILRKMKPSPGPVFTNRRGEPYKPSGLRSIFRRASAKVLGESNELTPYQLGHTFAQVASEQVPRDVLSKMLGHTDESTARFYYEVRSDRICRVAKSLKFQVAEAG
jgi:integrase